MEGSNAKASSAAADKYHGVTPEEVKKTRSKNPLKWFQRGGSKCASSSSASTPKQGAGVAENETKSRQPAAPIQRSSAPLVVNYFPSGMPLSRRPMLQLMTAQSNALGDDGTVLEKYKVQADLDKT